MKSIASPCPAPRRIFLQGAAALVAAGLLPRPAAAAPAGPPVARIAPVVDHLWGERVVDDYRWMENPADPEWLPFLRGQTKWARHRLDALSSRAKLLTRIAALSGDTPQVIEPRPAGGRVFHQRRLPGQTQYQLVVRDADGHDRVLVDPVSLAPVGRSASLDWWSPSPDGLRLAYGLSLGGSEAAVGHVLEVDSGRMLEDRLADVPYAAVAWLPDGSGFFYNRFAGRPPGDPAYYSDRSVWLHRPGTPQSADLQIMAAGMDPDVPMGAISSPEIQTGVGASQLALVVHDGYVRNFALYTADREAVLAGRARWTRVCGAEDGVSDFGLSGDHLFLVATAQTPRGRLLRTAAAGGTLATAKPVMAAGEAVLDELNPDRQGVFVTLNDGGEQSLCHVRADGSVRPIALPFSGWIQGVAVDAGAPAADAPPAATLVRISGWLSPGTVFTVDGASGRAERSALQPAPPIDLSLYETQRTFATARDGTRVPISIVARKGSRGRRGSCLVHAYGAYQWPSQPVFDPRAVALLEAGCVIATAHVRGGGEYGRAWHEAGQKARKPNTWRDLIDCCETLVAEGWTAPGRIAILGGSAGGIAVGRAMTERPALFGAVISKVGMSNPLRAEFEPNGQPNVPEFGSVATREGFLALRAMDTVQAVRDGVRYPPILLSTGVNDARVAPYNAAKLAARMQAARPGAEVLLRVDFDGGHEQNGLAKDRLDAEYADDFAFVLAHTTARRAPRAATSAAAR